MAEQPPVKFIHKHRPVPSAVAPIQRSRVDTQLGGVVGRHARFPPGMPANAQAIANRIDVAFWNGDPVFHSGHAFDEIALILAELDDRITALEP